MRRHGWTLIALALTLAACSSGGGSTSGTSAPASPNATVAPTPTIVPTPAVEPTATSAPSNPDVPVGSGMPAPGQSHGTIQPRTVTPKPGQLGVHPIAAERLAATVTGRKVVVEVTYASGVEPCYILDAVDVRRVDRTFAITLRQGHGPENGVCIQLAEIVRTFADLGELAPGTYTITDTQKGAPPISVTVT
jgi:glucose/arabinose dehydrogenase